MGVPVVTMNSGGMAELVEDGVTGGLAQAATPEAVAAAVRKCLEEEYYQILKENCQRRGQEIMGVEEYCDILIQKYKELIAKR